MASLNPPPLHQNITNTQPYEFGFVGQVNPEGKPHGFGTFMWPDMSIYEGQWLDGDRHGWGKHVFPSGDSYEGQWRYNLQYGEGQMVYASDYGPNQVHRCMIFRCL